MRKGFVIRALPLWAAWGTWMACAEDISSNLGRSDPPSAAPEIAAPRSLIESSVKAGGVMETHVDATAAVAWVYFDFQTAAEVHPETAESSADWDICFQRSKIKVNGGSSGTGGVKVVLVSSGRFEEVEEVPAAEWRTDGPDADADGEPDYAMTSGAGKWYVYDSSTHILTPAPIVYILRTVEGRHVKIQVLGYYNEAGTSGHPSFQWLFLD